jgi:hypothetical protein
MTIGVDDNGLVGDDLMITGRGPVSTVRTGSVGSEASCAEMLQAFLSPVQVCRTRLCPKTPSSARERAVFRLTKTAKQAILGVSSMELPMYIGTVRRETSRSKSDRVCGQSLEWICTGQDSSEHHHVGKVVSLWRESRRTAAVAASRGPPLALPCVLLRVCSRSRQYPAFDRLYYVSRFMQEPYHKRSPI